MVHTTITLSLCTWYIIGKRITVNLFQEWPRLLGSTWSMWIMGDLGVCKVSLWPTCVQEMGAIRFRGVLFWVLQTCPNSSRSIKWYGDGVVSMKKNKKIIAWLYSCCSRVKCLVKESSVTKSNGQEVRVNALGVEETFSLFLLFWH